MIGLISIGVSYSFEEKAHWNRSRRKPTNRGEAGLAANSLCPMREKYTMCELEVQIVESA